MKARGHDLDPGRRRVAGRATRWLIVGNLALGLGSLLLAVLDRSARHHAALTAVRVAVGLLFLGIALGWWVLGRDRVR